MTKFRTDDIVKTLQSFNLIRYFGGQVRAARRTLLPYADAQPFRPPQLSPCVACVALCYWQHSIYVSPKTLETYYTKAKPNWVIIAENVSSWYKPFSQRTPQSASAQRPT